MNELSVCERKRAAELSKDLPPYCALALTGWGMQRRRNPYLVWINPG
jgi:hypothetical protein